MNVSLPILFISDLHLSSHTAEFNDLFIEKLSYWQKSSDGLYIIGDLFEIWLGDDIIPHTLYPVLTALKHYSEKKPLYFMAGNRDFLVGTAFLQQIGATFLPDPSLIHLYGQNLILSHGDMLCTADQDYQKFRSKVQQPKWQQKILAKPRIIRKIIGHLYRHYSYRRGKKKILLGITDVTKNGLDHLQQHFEGAPHTLIHGHTHQPTFHQENFRGISYKRYVLPDWRPGIHGGLALEPCGHLHYFYF